VIRKHGQSVKEALALRAERKEKRKRKARLIFSGKPRLPSIKTLKEKRWAQMKQITVLRDGPMCVTCPVAFPGEPVQPGGVMCHIAPENEGQAATWDIINVYNGCYRCNSYERNFRARWERIIFPAVFPKERLEAIWENARRTVQYRRPDFMQMLAEGEKMILDISRPVTNPSEPVPNPNPTQESK
jgi:5-methylcytosine-specific restriction endonuclease McrA